MPAAVVVTGKLKARASKFGQSQAIPPAQDRDQYKVLLEELKGVQEAIGATVTEQPAAYAEMLKEEEPAILATDAAERVLKALGDSGIAHATDQQKDFERHLAETFTMSLVTVERWEGSLQPSALLTHTHAEGLCECVV